MTFVFLILDFYSFFIFIRTSLKTTYLRDGRFLLKDSYYYYYYLMTVFIDFGFVISARNLASFTGQIISTSPVAGNLSLLLVIITVLTLPLKPYKS